MSAELLFNISQSLALFGWGMLIFAPKWKSSLWLNERIIIPVILGGIYLVLITSNFQSAEGGFSSLGEIRKLFNNDYLLLAGWVHYLAFDLFVGSWIVRHSQTVGYKHWLIIVPLIFTFLAGPVGVLLYVALNLIKKEKWINLKVSS